MVLLACVALPLALAAPPQAASVTSPADGAQVSVSSPSPTVTITGTATASSSGTIVSMNFLVNGTSVGTDTTATAGVYSVSWSPTSPGTYTLAVIATDSSSSTGNTLQSNPVSVTVTSVRLASILAPANNAGIPRNSEIFLRSSATMSDGVLARVEYYLSGALVATAAAAPFNAPVTLSVDPGTHTLTAKAVDNVVPIPVTFDSAPVTIVVAPQTGTGPTVSINSPLNNDSVAAGSAVTITATASDTDGFIPNTSPGGVTFYADGDPIGTDLTAPYSVTWTPTVPKTVSLRAQTIDDRGNLRLNSLATNTVNVTVTSSAPTVSITAPSNNSTATVGVPLFVTATAAAATGATVASVQFFENGVAIGAADTAAPFAVQWTPGSVGTAALTARVTDSLGNNVTSAAVNVSVGAAPPTVSLSAPSTAVVNTATTLTATATAGTNATLLGVQFLAGTTVLGNVTTAPYTFSWTPTATGNVTLTARATDSNGGIATSAGVVVAVATSVPTVSITSPTNGTTLTAGTSTTLTATAAPSNGATVNRVDFLIGSTIIGTALTAPYSISWTPTTTGIVALTARVTDSTAATATSSVVNVSVTGSGGPTISLTAPSPGRIVSIGNNVTVTATAAATAPATVSAVEFLASNTVVASADVSGGGPSYSSVWRPTAAGTFALTARVTDSALATATSSPAINITVVAAPTVAVTGPTSAVSAGTATTVTASATAGTSLTVTNVEFFVTPPASTTPTSIGSSGTAPYSVSWTPTIAGTNVLTARVTDSSGTVVTSNAFNVTVTGVTTTPPTVTLATTGSLSIPAGSSRVFTASPTPAAGIDRVELLYDGTVVASDNLAPYAFVFTAPATGALGTHTLQARAVDSAGASGVSAPALVINITSPVGQQPLIGITTPSANAFLGPAVATTISGTALDNDGGVTSVQVLVNGTTTGLANNGLATLSGSAWSVTWTTPTVAGTYSLVAIASDANGNAVAAPPVNVTVGDSASPTLALLLLPGTAGSPASATLPSGAVRNIVANATASSGRAIVRVEFFVDGAKVGEDTSVPFTFRYVAPALGSTEQSRTFVFSARATDNAGAARDAFQPLLVVQPVGLPPTVNLLTPTNNTSVFPNSDVSLAATAVPATGAAIANVQFFVNGNLAGITTANPVGSAPYVATFRPTAPGTYTLDAIATDDRGNTAVSNSATVTAAFATPTVIITTPNPNATARATPGVPFGLAANAVVQSGTGAGILLVEFLLDGVQIGADTTAPYSISWTPTTAQLGQHRITARVTDTNSQTATSAPVNVIVATIVGTPPSVNITQPAPGGGVGQAGNLQTLSTVNFVANAASSVGTISNVEFFLNDVSIGLASREQTTNTYRLAYDLSRFDFSNAPSTTNPNTGVTSYTPIPLYAIARDNNNNQTVTNPLTLTINASTSSPPSISIMAFSPNIIAQNTQFLIGPTFSDSDGTVTQLQLFANGQLVQTVGNPQPFQFLIYNATTAGRFNLHAVVTDDTGNTAVSPQTLLVNVTPVSAPPTTITRPADDSTVTTVGAPVFLEGTATNSDSTQVPTLLFIATSSSGAIRQQILGQRVGTTTTYRAIWQPTAPATYSVVTQANLGPATSTSSVSRTVVVNNLSGLGPTVSIANGVPTSTQTASRANFTATATDPDGSVVDVEFFLNRNSIGKAQQDPGANTWRLTASFAGLLPGNVEVVALARDSAGNVAASTTNNISVSAAASIAPSITITTSTTNAAFNRQVQLRANARDTDGVVSSVQYFANAVSLGTSNNAGTSYQVNWTPNQSGLFRVWAVATDNSGVTTVSPTVEVTVRRNNPIQEDAAFILQTYQDLANTTNINPLIFDDLDSQLASGSLTRGDVVARLVSEPAFATPVNVLAAYLAIMGQWPTSANYASILATARTNGLAAAIGAANQGQGTILGSNEYTAKFTVVPTTALLNSPTSTIPADTFIARLWQNAGYSPSMSNSTPEAANVAFRSNTSVQPTLGRGYNAVGLPTALAEFVTNTNSRNTAFFDRARAAALFYQLGRPLVTMTTDEITARIDTLTRLGADAVRNTTLTGNDRNAAFAKPIADAILKDTIYAYRYVTITRHPESLVVAPRSGVILSVEAIGAPPLTYQWLLNGAPVAGATTATLSLPGGATTPVGTYTVVITSSANTATSDPATLTLSTTPTRLANISTRGVTTGGANVLIGGFVVFGTNQTQTRQMLIRVIGPSLAGAPFNVQGTLADPRLELYAGSAAAPVLQNDNWANQTGGAAQVTAIQQATTRAGAFTLSQNSLDAVVLATLPPGNYTVQARGPANNPNASGVVLIEAYDVTPNAAAPGRAMNVSTRGTVGTGANILIAGFVVNGGVSRRVLIRGVGPTLARFGLPASTVLADPQLTLIHQESGRTLATNDDWASNDDTAGTIAAAANAAGAFALNNGSKDAAMIVMLAPGAYTVQLSGVNNTQGIAIVEVYDVDR